MKKQCYSFFLSFVLVSSFTCLNKGVKANYCAFRGVIIALCSFLSITVNLMLFKKKCEENFLYSLAFALLSAICDYVVLYFFLGSLMTHSIAFIFLTMLGFSVCLFIFDEYVTMEAAVLSILMLIALVTFEMFEMNGVQVNQMSLESTLLKPQISFLLIGQLAYACRLFIGTKFNTGNFKRSLFHNISLFLFGLVDAFQNSFADVKILLSNYQGLYTALIVFGTILLFPIILASSNNMYNVKKEALIYSLVGLIIVFCAFYSVKPLNSAFGKNRLEVLGSLFYLFLFFIFISIIISLCFHKKYKRRRAESETNNERNIGNEENTETADDENVNNDENINNEGSTNNDESANVNNTEQLAV